MIYTSDKLRNKLSGLIPTSLPSHTEAWININKILFSRDLPVILNSITEMPEDINFLDYAVEDPTKVSYYNKARLEKVVKELPTEDLPLIRHIIESESFRKSTAYMGKPVKVLKRAFPDLEWDLHKCEHVAGIFRHSSYEFRLVSGEDIRKYYLRGNYARDTEIGSLGGSCMKNEGCQKYLDIYVKNPEVRLLISVDTNSDKIRGRALVWSNVHSPETSAPFTLMDRIYADTPIQELFKAYAQEQGWCHKTRQSVASFMITKPSGDTITSAEVHGDFTFDYYPYIDTFNSGAEDFSALYMHDDGPLVFDSAGGSYSGGGHCCSMCGDPSEDGALVDDEWICDDCLAQNYSYIEGLERFVHNDDAAYCERCDTTVLAEDSTEVEGNIYVCDDCLFHHYSWDDENSEYIRNEDAIHTEEGQTFHVDSGAWAFCHTCEEIHDIEELVEHTDGNLYCTDCVPREEEPADDESSTQLNSQMDPAGPAPEVA
jgi:hypothetical protein